MLAFGLAALAGCTDNNALESLDRVRQCQALAAHGLNRNPYFGNYSFEQVAAGEARTVLTGHASDLVPGTAEPGRPPVLREHSYQCVWAGGKISQFTLN